MVSERYNPPHPHPYPHLHPHPPPPLLIILTVLIVLTIIALLVPITSLIYITAKVKPVIIGYVLVPVTAVMWAAVMWVLLVVPLVVEMGFEIFFDRPVIHITLEKPVLLLQLQNVSACKNWVKKKNMPCDRHERPYSHLDKAK